jgi:Plasmid pRiA4b ORF-3-like protein
MTSMKKRGSADKKALQLKIQLLGVEPEIWRRILVPSLLTLRELHAVI